MKDGFFCHKRNLYPISDNTFLCARPDFCSPVAYLPISLLIVVIPWGELNGENFGFVFVLQYFRPETERQGKDLMID